MGELSFGERYGPWALVTGAAMGIGAEFARALAARGLNLVLVDIRKEPLRLMCGDIRKTGVEAVPVVADLANPDFPAAIRKASARREIGLLVNNAAWGTVGNFVEMNHSNLDRTISINCRAPMLLAREYGRIMADRRRGGIIFLSSASAVQVTPLLANYAATKAYSLVLAEALWEELRGYGVDVLALSPGATNTPGFYESGAKIEKLRSAPFMEASEVVVEALEVLGKKPSLIPGRMNRLAAFVLTRLMSRSKALAVVGKNMRILYGDIRYPR